MKKKSQTETLELKSTIAEMKKITRAALTADVSQQNRDLANLKIGQSTLSSVRNRKKKEKRKGKKKTFL